MSLPAASWVDALWAAPAVLAPLPLMQLWLRLGWGLVLAALVVVAWDLFAPRRFRPGGVMQLRALALACLAVCALPAGWSPTYWLGLAFQAPSLASGAWAAVILVQRLSPSPWSVPPRTPLPTRWAAAGAVLGWVLLLDSFALWPVFLYPTGFGLWLIVAVAAWVLAPWAWSGGNWRHYRPALVAGAVLAVFAITRLPSGNLWDALLDPWLWLVCQVVLLRRILVCYRKRS